ncbi:MAG: Na+/H+ antiporter NhaC [Flavobacterium sp. MedPE-SWcel]|uniref:Na+/H+ antiporter NhaC n=1 Tax=uncultured Flavobacterium sp. TaxID=165435 RepID=UPI00091A1291|nr:Na+/H+ antiporter NhaC [uncultured Flavobacterium sp.]OIQ16633.1 MAG: Na+/H+ antiporter NhaC [Flavobacterium sp. MedPE-SWcel]
MENTPSTSDNKKTISLFQALIPVILLVIILAYNVKVFGDDALSGSNQFVLLLGGAIAAIVGFANKIPYSKMLKKVSKNIKSTAGAILILLLVGALSGTWLLSGIIPAMIYYGLQILSPDIFLPACVVICSIISIATGSSWTTSATVGIALIGIGNAMGMNSGMVAGAVISGAYFGDKMSPLSDTTNLAPAMAGADLFSHIRYMALTTVPTYVITLIIFIILGFSQTTSGAADTPETLAAITDSFNISGWLFIVPLIVVGLIVKKTEPLIALLFGTLLGGFFAIIFQPELVAKVGGSETLNFVSGYKGVMNAITVETTIETTNEMLSGLFTSGGMQKMMGTIWLILCAMVFGGVMEAIGALKVISNALLRVANGVFGLFASTVASCLVLNVTASDQYLAIVVPGKMFANAYKEKGLAPENLSRTLEDSGTVTSVLIPWNTCGAYQSGVLGVSTFAYLPYAFFNLMSPIMTLIFAAFHIKIKTLLKK